ncbi:MAG: hypothetical protein FWD57_04440 [Polyangiaceae bacterium]|nr:hypothetical protein [Polyangiaceae bacterium]
MTPFRHAIAAVILAIATTTGCDTTTASKSGGSDKSDLPQASGSSTTLHRPLAPATANPSPIEALHQRTYAIELEGAIAHAGTTAGVVSWDFSNRTNPRRKAVLVLRDSVNHITKIPPSSQQPSSLLAVSTGPSGIAIVDASQVNEGTLTLRSTHPSSPEFRKQCHAAWRFVAVSASTGYLACGGSGVVRVNIALQTNAAVQDSPPNQAVVTIDRHAAIPGYVRDIAALDSNRVIAAAGKKGLALIDFRNPQARVVDHLELDGDVRGVDISGNRAYVAVGEAGFAIVDISGQSMKIVGKLLPKTTDMARSVAVHGSNALLCLGDSGLSIIDLANENQPAEIGRHHTKGTVNRVTINKAAGGENTLFLANDSDGVAIVDISNPQQPKRVYPAPADPN